MRFIINFSVVDNGGWTCERKTGADSEGVLLVTYQLHAEGAVVDGLALDVDVHERTGVGAALTGAKRGRHERLVAHGCG